MSIELSEIFKSNDIETIKRLLTTWTTGYLSSEKGISVLLFAASIGHIEIVACLLQHGASLQEKNINGDTALSIAIDNHYHNLIDWLLENGATIDQSLDAIDASELSADAIDNKVMLGLKIGFSALLVVSSSCSFE